MCTLTHRANTFQLLKLIILVSVITIDYTLISTFLEKKPPKNSVSKHLSAVALQGDSSSSDRGDSGWRSLLSELIPSPHYSPQHETVHVVSSGALERSTRPGGCKPVRSHIRISSRGLQPFRRFYSCFLNAIIFVGLQNQGRT